MEPERELEELLSGLDECDEALQTIEFQADDRLEQAQLARRQLNELVTYHIRKMNPPDAVRWARRTHHALLAKNVADVGGTLRVLIP